MKTLPAVVLAALLAGCTSTGAPTPQLQQVATDANLVVSGVGAELKQVQLLYPAAIKPGDAVKLQTDLAAAQTALASLATLTATPATGTQIQVIETNINEIVSIASAGLAAVPACQAVPQCSAITVGLSAASVLLPGLEIMANSLIAGNAAPAPAPAPKAAMAGIGEDRARLILMGAASGSR